MSFLYNYYTINSVFLVKIKNISHLYSMSDPSGNGCIILGKSDNTCCYCKKRAITNPSHYKQVCDCSLEIDVLSGLNTNYDMCMNEYEMEFKSTIEAIKNYNGEKTFMNVFSNTLQQISTNQSVMFDSQNVVNGKCYHDIGSPSLWIWEPGFYMFQFSLYCVEPSQFSVMKNGNIIVPGSTIGSLSGSAIMNHTFMIEITLKDFSVSTGLPIPLYACKLEIVNNTQSTSNVVLPDYGSSSNNLPQITSSVCIYCLFK